MKTEKKRVNMRTKIIPVSGMTVAITMLLATAVISSMITTENVFAGKFENNQAASTTNSCLNPLFESSTFDFAADIGNCGNTVSQQEGGGEASSPITLQIASPTIEVQAPPTEQPEPPEPQTCEECFTAFLTPEQIEAFEETLSAMTIFSTIEEVCEELEDLPPEALPGALEDVAGLLEDSGIDQSTIDEIIDCLERVLGL